MKKLVASVLVVLITATSIFAQETLREVVRDFQRNNSEFTLVIPSFLIKAGLAFGEMEDEEREVLKQIDDMKIVICDHYFSNYDFHILEDGIKSGKFSELMTVKEQDETVRMIMNKKSERKSEMLMLVESDDETVMMLFNFKGEPDFKKFMALVD